MSTSAAGAPRRKRRARGSISAEEILQGAYELVTEESLEALSMPRLAQRLGVGATSIYWYFRNKDELLDRLAERAMTEFVDEFDVPADLPWDEHLRAYFRNYRKLFLENELLADLITTRAFLSPESSRIAAQRVDRLLGVLVDEGFPPETAMSVYGSLSLLTQGSVMWGRRTTPDPSLAAADLSGMRELEVLPLLQRPPWLASAHDDFEFGLENAISGLRFLRDEPSPGN